MNQKNELRMQICKTKKFGKTWEEFLYEGAGQPSGSIHNAWNANVRMQNY